MNLDHLLKPEHRAAGLHLEDDEDFVYLTCRNEGLGIWRANVTRDIILAAAYQYLKLTDAQRYRWNPAAGATH